MKLTEKQLRFCEAYLIDPNATQAAIKAGYSKKTAQRTGSENLSKPLVQSFLDAAKIKSRETATLTLAQIDEALARMAEDGELRPADRLKAYDMLVKRQGGFLEKLEVKQDIRVEIVALDEL